MQLERFLTKHDFLYQKHKIKGKGEKPRENNKRPAEKGKVTAIEKNKP